MIYQIIVIILYMNTEQVCIYEIMMLQMQTETEGRERGMTRKKVPQPESNQGF